MAVAEEIQVLTDNAVTFRHPVFPVAVHRLEKMAGALVYHGPAVTGYDARIVRVHQRIPVAAVEGAGRSEQIPRIVHPGMPLAFLLSVFRHQETDAQIFFVEIFLPLVFQGQEIRFDSDRARRFPDFEFRDVKTAVHYAESGAVLEFPVGGPLHTHKTRSQDSETGVPENDFGFR